MTPKRAYSQLAFVAAAVLCSGIVESLAAADEQSLPPNTTLAWTMEEALFQLQFFPDDAYLQYVALQLAREKGQTDQVAGRIRQLNQHRWGGRPVDRRVDLFDLFTGALAVQESLQLDTMLGVQGNTVEAGLTQSVKIADLSGPAVESHPWEKMLAMQDAAGKQAEIGPLDLCVPADQHYFVFRSLTKLLEAIDLGNVWGAHLFSQAGKYARTERTSDRLKAQLAIETDWRIRPLYDMVVEEVAVTGSDLFFREGTDVTMLFRLKQPKMFKIRSDGFLDSAVKSRPDAVRSTGRIGQVDYVSLTTPDRAVHVFAAYPRPDLHVRSNSLAALQRVLTAVAGEDGITRLGETPEFKYIRTLLPRGAEEEDGLIYFSDPFIRRLVGPEVKLTERRRMICYNHLRMIGHAAMLYRTQYGKSPNSLDELFSAGCGPDPVKLVCPCGGAYSLATDGTTGSCSHHGNVFELTPCREIPLQEVSQAEAEQYRQFVAEYNRYWTRYFDPIAVRIRITPEQYRAETIVLPLIDNSVYSGMALALGGEPEPLDVLPVPKRNIFSMAMRMNKETMLKHDRGLLILSSELKRCGIAQRIGGVSVEEFLSNGLGNQISLHICDATPMFDFNLTGFLGEMFGSFRGAVGRQHDMMMIACLVSSLQSPVYIAIPVKDAQIVDQFLHQLDEDLAVLAQRPEGGGWFGVDFDFYRLSSEENGDQTRCYGVRLGPLKWRLFFARIDSALYIASQNSILDDLAALSKQPTSSLSSEEAVETKAANQGPTAHAMIRIRPDNWNQSLPGFQLGWAESSRDSCLKNLGPLSAAARAMAACGLDPRQPAILSGEVERLYGAYCFCPDGGRYEASPDGRQVRCSVHGTAQSPRQLMAPSPGSPMGQITKEFRGLTAELTFLEDGLHAVVIIQRK